MTFTVNDDPHLSAYNTVNKRDWHPRPQKTAKSFPIKVAATIFRIKRLTVKLPLSTEE